MLQECCNSVTRVLEESYKDNLHDELDQAGGGVAVLLRHC
jgi:hypothetical protein